MFSFLGSCPGKMISHLGSSSRKISLSWITISLALIKLLSYKMEAKMYKKTESYRPSFQILIFLFHSKPNNSNCRICHHTLSNKSSYILYLLNIKPCVCMCITFMARITMLNGCSFVYTLVFRNNF